MPREQNAWTVPVSVGPLIDSPFETTTAQFSLLL